jgi:hypothetical protein
MISKTKKFALAIAIASVVLPVLPASASTSSKYYSWKRATLPAISKMVSDYSSLTIDLGNGNGGGALADLTALGNDARVINNHANSPDYTLNFDLNKLALALATLSSAGKSTLNGGPIGAWRSATNGFNNAETVFTNRLGYDNNRW